MGFLTSPSPSYRPLPFLTEEAASDLMIGEFLNNLFREAQGDDYTFDWSKYFTDQEEDLLYRRRVLAELKELPKVVQSIRNLVSVLAQIRTVSSLGIGEDISGALRELDLLRLSYDSLRELSELLKAEISRGNVCSEGLLKLSDICAEKLAADFSLRFSDSWDTLAGGLAQVSSLCIRFTLDDELRTEGVAVSAVSDQKITHQALPIAMDLLHAPKDLSAPKDMTSPLKEVVQTEVRNTHRLFLDTLRRISDDLEELNSDLLFYLSALLYMEKLDRIEAPYTFAKLCPKKEKTFKATGLYNPVLALLKDRIPVANDIDFADKGEILILTGINQGGKTTFLRSVGLTQALAQFGWPVPAEKAYISPCDRIVTVFSHEEDTRLQHGKLGQELKTIRHGLDLCSADSFVLFNEPVTGTSPLENLYLSREVLVSCKLLNIRGIWVTHLYDLAAEASEMNENLPGSTVSSIIAIVNKEDESVSASYRIKRGAPEFTSYAREMLAKKK